MHLCSFFKYSLNGSNTSVEKHLVLRASPLSSKNSIFLTFLFQDFKKTAMTFARAKVQNFVLAKKKTAKIKIQTVKDILQFLKKIDIFTGQRIRQYGFASILTQKCTFWPNQKMP